jgi:hypothetical protein
MTENTEADAIMALHKQVLVETGWECSTDSPPALKRAADAFRAEVERVVAERDATTQHLQDEYGAQIKALSERAERAEAMLKDTRSYLHSEELERAERDNEALRSLLKEAREWLADPSLDTWPYMEGGRFYSDKSKWIARIDDALAK